MSVSVVGEGLGVGGMGGMMSPADLERYPGQCQRRLYLQVRGLVCFVFKSRGAFDGGGACHRNPKKSKITTFPQPPKKIYISTGAGLE